MITDPSSLGINSKYSNHSLYSDLPGKGLLYETYTKLNIVNPSLILLVLLVREKTRIHFA